MKMFLSVLYAFRMTKPRNGILLYFSWFRIHVEVLPSENIFYYCILYEPDKLRSFKETPELTTDSEVGRGKLIYIGLKVTNTFIRRKKMSR